MPKVRIPGEGAAPSFADDRIGHDEAARIIGLQASSLELKDVRTRLNIPHYKIGRRVFYRRSELERWVSTRAVARAA